MSEQGTPQESSSSLAPEPTHTIDPNTGAVTTTTGGETGNPQVHHPTDRSPFSPEVMEQYGETINRYKREDGSFDYENMVKTLAEQRRMISAGEHKKAPEGEASNVQATPEASDAPPAGEPKGEEAAASSPPEPTAEPKGEAPEGDTLTFAQLDTLMQGEGITQDHIDRFIAGGGDWDVAQIALEANANKRADLKKSQEDVINASLPESTTWKSLKDWAATNLPEADLNHFNEAYLSGDLRRLELEVISLQRKREAVEGISGTHFGGASTAGNSAQAADVFQSDAEYSAFMSNPNNLSRMNNDRAYGAYITAKANRSAAAGKIRIS